MIQSSIVATPSPEGRSDSGYSRWKKQRIYEESIVKWLHVPLNITAGLSNNPNRMTHKYVRNAKNPFSNVLGFPDRQITNTNANVLPEENDVKLRNWPQVSAVRGVVDARLYGVTVCPLSGWKLERLLQRSQCHDAGNDSRSGGSLFL